MWTLGYLSKNKVCFCFKTGCLEHIQVATVKFITNNNTNYSDTRIFVLGINAAPQSNQQ
jgi:hypothetical protein